MKKYFKKDLMDQNTQRVAKDFTKAWKMDKASPGESHYKKLILTKVYSELHGRINSTKNHGWKFPHKNASQSPILDSLQFCSIFEQKESVSNIFMDFREKRY